MASVPRSNAVDVLDWAFRMSRDRGTTVPRINDEFLNSVIYLYSSVPDAEGGEASGGSGFILGVPSTRFPGTAFVFAVTNRHIIDGGSTVIRLNTKDGKARVEETDERDWVCHSDGSDVAICPLLNVQDGDDIQFVSIKHFATRRLVEVLDIGPGDDVFVVCRFVNRDGRQKNLPTARFGRIAQMPSEPITVTGIKPQEAYLVEAKSIGGFSGSPVFVYIEPMGLVAGRKPKTDQPPPENTTGPWLLGVDFCHILDWSPVCDAARRPLNNKTIAPWDQQVKVNTGMMGVAPVWKLEELLAMPKIKKHIENEEKKLEGNRLPMAELDSLPSKTSPTHREDFNRLLGAAVKPPKSSDQT